MFCRQTIGHDFMESKQLNDKSECKPLCTNQFLIVLSGMPDVKKILEEMEIDLSLNAEANIDERTKPT